MAAKSNAKRRVPKDKIDKLEVGCAACCGQYCRSNPYNNALCCSFMLMWVTLLILWLGGAYFGGQTSSTTTPSTSLPACSNHTLSVGFAGQDPYVWWISTSGIIVIITVCASCLYCCAFIGAVCGGLPPAVTYISAAGLVIALLGYGVFLAWVGVGTYLAAMVTNSARCTSYIFYLIFFYISLLSLVACGAMSVVWKVHGVRTTKEKNGTSSDKKLLTV